MMGEIDDLLLGFDHLDTESTRDNTKYDLGQIQAKVETVLSQILIARFGSSLNKTRIEDKDDRYNFACPYCGDSMDDTRKRGNIYKDDFNFKCYNCGEFAYFKDFLEKYGYEKEFTPGELRFLRENAESLKKTTLASGNFNRFAAELAGVDDIAIPRAVIMERMRLMEVRDHMHTLNELRRRKQVPKNGDLRHFAYNRWDDHLVMFNLTPSREKVIGLQSRVQKPRRGQSRFLSKKYSDILTDVLGLTNIKAEIADKLDKFSLFYNVMCVNYNLPVTVFESTIDSHHMSNSIAQWSATNVINLSNGRYFYDSSRIDATGRKEAIAAMKDGKSVFLWGAFLDDYPQFTMCKDLNDIFIKEEVNENILGQYFSTTLIDMRKL